MSKFKLKALNFSRCRRWIIDAENRRTDDPVYAFIAAWISFNHYYSTYASSNFQKFTAWSRNNFSGSTGDKAQWNYLISSSEFAQFFIEFKKHQSSLFEIKINLPVKNMLSNTIFLRKSRAFLLVTAKVDGFYSQKQRFLHKLTGESKIALDL